jgi:hypothetical protein
MTYDNNGMARMTYRELCTKLAKIEKQFKRGMISSYEKNERQSSVKAEFYTMFSFRIQECLI